MPDFIQIIYVSLKAVTSQHIHTCGLMRGCAWAFMHARMPAHTCTHHDAIA